MESWNSNIFLTLRFCSRPTDYSTFNLQRKHIYYPHLTDGKTNAQNSVFVKNYTCLWSGPLTTNLGPIKPFSFKSPFPTDTMPPVTVVAALLWSHYTLLFLFTFKLFTWREREANKISKNMSPSCTKRDFNWKNRNEALSYFRPIQKPQHTLSLWTQSSIWLFLYSSGSLFTVNL